MSIFRTQNLPGRTVRTVEGLEYLYFSGTDYLGMGHNPEYLDFIREGLDLYGSHYGSSRNNSLRLDIYEETEQSLARFVKSPSSLIVSSGMWAGQLVMKTIEAIVDSKQKLQYHYAPRVHPALWGNQYRSEKVSWNEWASSTVKTIFDSNTDAIHIICTDAIGSPVVENFDFSVFEKFTGNQNIWLIVDDSHSLGVRGENGMGVFSELHPRIDANTLVVSSLNKALGIPSGAIFGAQDVIDKIRTSPWYAGASPPAPAFIHALNQLLNTRCFENAHDILTANISYLNKKLGNNNDFDQSEGYPVFCSREVRLFSHLLDNRIMSSCFAYPSPSDPPITRLAVNALHQKKDLDHLAEVCNQFYSS